MRAFDIAGVRVGNDLPLVVIAGPCQLESTDHALMIAERLAGICAGLGLGFIFKASFDKANRSALGTPRGPGLAAGLDMLAEVKTRLGVPVLTDVHLPEHCAPVARVADVLQIPAFLCRQTDLLLAAGQTGRAVNVKKGQFLAPEDMHNVVEKIASRGNHGAMICERGTSFGYNNLIVDFRSIPVMQAYGQPVIFDATHSTQRPGGLGDRTGGDRDMAPALAAAAVAVGADGVFLETHPDPDSALSDAATMLPCDTVGPLLQQLKAIAAAAAGRPQ